MTALSSADIFFSACGSICSGAQQPLCCVSILAMSSAHSDNVGTLPHIIIPQVDTAIPST